MPCADSHRRLRLMSGVAPLSSLHIGPLSPTSPPVDPPKTSGSLPSNPDHQNPQTPTSPPLMSVSAQSHAANFSSHASPGQATSKSATLSSPSSSAPMSSQHSNQQTLSAMSSFPTPASSVSGHLPNPNSIEDTEHPKGSGQSAAISDAMDIDGAGHRRTDHDRDDRGGNKGSARGVVISNSQTGTQDAMDVDERTVGRRKEGDPDLASLQRELDSAFHLCKTCKVSLRWTSLLTEASAIFDSALKPAG